MFVGRIGFQQNFQTGFLSGQQKTLSRLQQSIQQSKVQNNKDTFTQSSHHTIYLETDKGVNRLTPLKAECITYAEYSSVVDLTKEILPPSEKDYTEKDALMYQYIKQHATSLTLEKDGIEAPRFFMGIGNIAEEELENFRQELVKNGVDKEIDWWQVHCNFSCNDITLDNVSKIEQKIDYVCSRYAVLKNRIETEFTGEEKEKNMQILNDMYDYGKQDLIESYAKNVGSFFENLGQSGVSEDMKDSLNAIIDQKIAEYEDYIAKNENFASISNEEDTWLYQDDAFMAAQLRKSMAASKGITENIDAKSKYDYHHSNRFDFSEYLQNNVKGNITGENLTNKTEKEFSYSLEDLKFAGIYANTMQSYLDASYWGYGNKNNDTALGKQFAQEFRNIKNITSKLNIGENLKKTIEKTFRPFLNKLMDKIDKGIEENRKDPLFNLRFSYINRIAVFNAFSV